MKRFLGLILTFLLLSPLLQAQEIHRKSGSSSSGSLTGVPVFAGSSLYPVYQNGHVTQATLTAGSNTFTVTDATNIVPGIQVFGGFAGGTFVSTVSGLTITTANFMASPNATITGITTIGLGLNRWSTTSAFLANDIAGQYGWFGSASKNSWTPAGNYRSWQNDQTQTVVDAQSPNGLTALYGFTRTSDHISGGGAAQGIETQCINDSAPAHHSCWGSYTEVWSMPGDIGASIGQETTAFDYNSRVASDPYNVNPTAGIHIARFDCGNAENGIVAMTSYPCSAGVEVVNNGQPLAGPAFLVGAGAMDTSVVSDPSAMGLPSGVGIGWYSAAGDRTWSIAATSISTTVLNNKINLATNFISIQGSNGTLYQLFNDTTAGNGEIEAGMISGVDAGNYASISGSPNGSESTFTAKSGSGVDTAPNLRVVTNNSTGSGNGRVNIQDDLWLYRNSSNTSQATVSGSTSGAPTISCGGQSITNCTLILQGSGTGSLDLAGTVFVPGLTINLPVYTDGSDHLVSTPPLNYQPVMGPTGTITFNHKVIGSSALVAGVATITLSGNAVFTSTSTYNCVANDNSGAALSASVQKQSGTSIKLFGTSTDTINYECTGN